MIFTPGIPDQYPSQHWMIIVTFLLLQIIIIVCSSLFINGIFKCFFIAFIVCFNIKHTDLNLTWNKAFRLFDF